MGDHHHHHHEHHHVRAASRSRLGVVLVVTTLYLGVEVAGGIITGSLALLADAGHMLTDVAGLALALFAMKFAERPATPERTYGFYRVEILAALANAAVLLVVSLFVLYEAVRRFLQPPEVAAGPMLIVTAVGIVVNVVGVVALRGGSSKSLNMKGAYFEVLSDLLASLGVLAAAAIMRWTRWYYADPLISAVIGLVIIPRTWHLVKEAVGVLLEGTPADINLPALRQTLLGLPGVGDIHDLHVWTLTSGVHAMSAHAVLCKGALHGDVLGALRACMRERFSIGHVTIQVESEECGDHELHL
jgi:cobalt-zinc-cadmium efflux system protein